MLDWDDWQDIFYQHADTVGQGLLTYDDVNIGDGRNYGNITYDQAESNGPNKWPVRYDGGRM